MASRLPMSLSPSFSSFRIAPVARRSFTTTAPACYKEKRQHYNPYAEAAAKKLREENKARQAELTKKRETAYLDPVMGNDTAFTSTIDKVHPALPPVDAVTETPANNPLNHFLKVEELPEFLERSKQLSAPVSPPDDPNIDYEALRKFETRHNHAVEAIRRIVALGNGSSADKTRWNKQRCIEEFGRHNTDAVLSKDPGIEGVVSTKTPRVGADTGSSEVQAAILTVKIRALRKAMDDMGSFNKDKHNKRNLRLMVHRRAKLLKYLKRKEKGGVRYRNVMEALGLDDYAIERELHV